MNGPILRVPPETARRLPAGERTRIRAWLALNLGLDLVSWNDPGGEWHLYERVDKPEGA